MAFAGHAFGVQYIIHIILIVTIACYVFVWQYKCCLIFAGRPFDWFCIGIASRAFVALCITYIILVGNITVVKCLFWDFTWLSISLHSVVSRGDGLSCCLLTLFLYRLLNWWAISVDVYKLHQPA